MLLQLSFAVLLLAIGQFASGQVVERGRCPQVEVMTEFDLEAYTGLWYQYARYPAEFEVATKCTFAKYGDLGNKTVSVQNGSIKKQTGLPENISGYAKVLGPASLAVVFSQGQTETNPNYQVLGTDYKNYAVVYSCKNLRFSHSTSLWILTRDRLPSEETLLAVKKIIDENGLSDDFIFKTEQENCPPLAAAIEA